MKLTWHCWRQRPAQSKSRQQQHRAAMDSPQHMACSSATTFLLFVSTTITCCGCCWYWTYCEVEGRGTGVSLADQRQIERVLDGGRQRQRYDTQQTLDKHLCPKVCWSELSVLCGCQDNVRLSLHSSGSVAPTVHDFFPRTAYTRCQLRNTSWARLLALGPES